MTSLPPDFNPVSPATSPTAGNAKPQNFGLILGGISAVILLLAALGSAAYVMTRPAASPVAERLQGLIDQLEKEHDKLEKEIGGLKSEVNGLESSRDKLQEDGKKLDLKKRELEAAIDKLTARQEILNRWKNVDLVLMNSKQQAVGLKKDGSAFQVFDKQEGDLAETVLAASRNLHIARTSDDAQLAKEVYNSVPPGEFLPAELATRLKKEIWKTHSFVEVRPDTSIHDIDMAVFRDVVTNDVRIGFLHQATADGIRVEARGAARELIPWSQIQPGSARHGTPDEILPMMGNVDFLEYSLLRVAQKLGTGESDSLRPRVIVHTDIEISREHIDFYGKLDQQLEIQGNAPFYMTAHTGAAAFFQLLAQLDRSQIPGRRVKFREEMLRTDPFLRARKMSGYVEDEVQSRLRDWGISTVTDKDLTKFESGSTPTGKAIRAATLHDATHLLMITIKEPQNEGDYHLSVKLYDETGKDTWVNEGERSLSPEARLERFHISSGQLALLTRLEKLKSISRETPKDALETAGISMASESPPVAPYVGSRSPTEQRSELVYVESTDGLKTRFRTLFDPQVKEIMTGVVDAKVVNDPSIDVPQDLIFRYIVARIAERILPPAGRVERVQGLTGEVTGLTSSRGIVPGERCRVLRAVDGQKSWSILPTEAELSEVGSSTGRVSFQKSGFEEFWSENVLLRTGDLLIPKQSAPRSIRVDRLVLTKEHSSVTGNLKLLTNPPNAKKYENQARHAADQISRILADALTDTGIPTAAPNFAKQDFSTTHKLDGTITLSKEMASKKYNSSSSPIFTVSVMLSEVNSNQDPMQITFDLTNYLN